MTNIEIDAKIKDLSDTIEKTTSNLYNRTHPRPSGPVEMQILNITMIGALLLLGEAVKRLPELKK